MVAVGHISLSENILHCVTLCKMLLMLGLWPGVNKGSSRCSPDLLAVLVASSWWWVEREAKKRGREEK